jgi:gliding motility-associated-like protein
MFKFAKGEFKLFLLWLFYIEMKRIILFSLLVFVTLFLRSQNLIPNPSFEDYYIINLNPPCFQIPCCSLAKATEWTYANLIFYPNLYGPHYFTCGMNFCTDSEWTIPYQGVPIHIWNASHHTLNGYYYQEAKDGCAYIAFLTYINFNNNFDLRQYPLIKLTDNLVIGRKYCLSLWISISDLHYYMTSNTIGAYFSTSPPVTVDAKVLQVIPQIENLKPDFPDTSNTWYLVSGSFVADSNYQYLTIGNFYSDSLTNVLVDSANFNSILLDFCFYMDMVTLYDCTGHDYSANAGNDTIICIGDTILIGTDDQHNRQYFWSPGSLFADSTAAKQLVSPVVATTYYLHVIDEFFLETWDTITVSVKDCPPEPEPEYNDIFIPNIFSPNNDNLNDVLYVRGEGIAQLSFVIFNRWGEKVFESNDPHQGWDGMFKGKQAETGVYVYMVSATLENGKTVKRSGNVTLVR